MNYYCIAQFSDMEILTDLTLSYNASEFSFLIISSSIANTGGLGCCLSIISLSNFSMKSICQYISRQNIVLYGTTLYSGFYTRAVKLASKS